MSPVHNASLIEVSHHSKEVLQLLDLDINRTLIDHLAWETSDVVDHALGRPTTSRNRSERCSKECSDFADSIANVLHTAGVRISTVLVTLVYIHRCKPHLSIETEDWALHRVFLGALILASKYTNDTTLKNSHWSIATGLFGKQDIGRIEREFLEVLDWELAVSESDLLDLHESLMALYPLRRFPRAQKRLVPFPSVRTILHTTDSESESSSPASSPEPSTPTSPPQHTGLRKTKPIKDLAVHISHALSILRISSPEDSSVLASRSYPHVVTA